MLITEINPNRPLIKRGESTHGQQNALGVVWKPKKCSIAGCREKQCPNYDERGWHCAFCELHCEEIHFGKKI